MSYVGSTIQVLIGNMPVEMCNRPSLYDLFMHWKKSKYFTILLKALFQMAMPFKVDSIKKIKNQESNTSFSLMGKGIKSIPIHLTMMILAR